MVNLTRIYTRTGDAGRTRLGDNSETTKTDLRLEAYADVEEVVLDPGEQRRDLRFEAAGDERPPELTVELVDRGVGLEPRVGLRGLGVVAEPGATRVSRARVDPGEVDHRLTLRRVRRS